MRKRNRHVSVWLTDREHDHLKKQAELAGLGIDPFVRNLIQGVNLRPRPPDVYAALLRELSAIGNNANQLAHRANSTGVAGQQSVDEMTRIAKEVWREIKENY